MQMEEVWKKIPNIEGYEVSSEGKVRSMAREIKVVNGRNGAKKRVISPRLLKACPTYINGHQHYVTVRLNGKTQYVHRLVASAFLGKAPFGPRSEVNHKDGNRHNNNLYNLEWCSKKMNEQHSQLLRAKRKAKAAHE
jgi:hypothetical protein